MKNKFKSIMLAFAILSGIQCYSQTLNYNDVTKATEKPKGYHDQYISKDGITYKNGDTLTMGRGSGENGTYVYIFGANARPDPNSFNRKIIIDGIYLDGNKKIGWKVGFITKPWLQFYVEDALASGEIKTLGMTSDEALSELKKWKDKLDLNIITEEEYNKKKEELTKWIK